MRAWIGWVLCAVLTCAGRPATAEPPELARRTQEGTRAPAYCWPVADGCAARTGATDARPPQGPYQVAWEQPLAGDPEGEPLVWDQVVVVAQRGAGERLLTAHRLSDGRVFATLRLKSPVPLAPSLWRNLVVVRTDAGKLGAFSVGRAAFSKVWSYDTQGPWVSPPVLLGRDCFASAAQGVLRLAVGEPKPVWTAYGTFRGRPSVAGARVYALSYDTEGNASVVALARDDGREADRAGAGHHDGDIPSPEDTPAIAVLGEHLLVHHALPVPLKGGTKANAVWLPRDSAGGDLGRTTGFLRLVDHATAAPEGWLAVEQAFDGPTVLRYTLGWKDGEAEGYLPLAEPDAHPELLGPSVSTTLAGRIAFKGRFAFDVGSRELLEPLPVDPTSRVVPARHTLLAFLGKRLVALRPAPAPPGPPLLSRARAPGAPGPSPGTGSVAFADGTVHVGPVALDLAQGTLDVTTDPKTPLVRPLAEAALVLDDGGRVLHAVSAEGLLLGLEQIHEDVQARALAVLAREAVQANDERLGQRLLLEALARGAPDGLLKGLDVALESLRKKAKPVKADAVDAVRVKEQALAPDAREAVADALASLPPEVPWSARAAVIRWLLARDPQQAAATALVRARVPKALPVREPFAPLEWLELIAIYDHTPIGLLEVPPEGARRLLPKERELGAARAAWRPDLLGLETRQILVLSPLAAPQRVARCLALGELVCEWLEDLCSHGKVVRPDPQPLIVHLFDSRKEFIQRTLGVKGFADEENRLEIASWASHYDDAANVTRLWVNDQGEDAQRLAGSLAFTIAQHWITERCPLFLDSERGAASSLTPCAWVSYGLPMLARDLVFDPGARHLETRIPRAGCLDVVASAPADVLLPWRALLAAPWRDVLRLDDEKRLRFPMRHRLGWSHVTTRFFVAYEQAAATCLYLHAQGGALRDGLATILRDYVVGRVTPESMEAVLGIPADELGRRVLAFAREAQEGRWPDAPPR